MTDTKGKKVRGMGRANFLAHRDQFARMIEAGQPLRVIYEDHKEALGFGYPQFTKYVSRYIRSEPDDQQSAAQPEQPRRDDHARPGTDNADQERQEQRDKGPFKGFDHNPQSHDRDDLV